MALGKVAFGKAKLYYYVFIALAVVALAYYVLKYTKFGRGVYAVGGGEQSAVLMGLPVARTKISVYAISGFCAALAGVVFSFYTLAGYSLQNMGLELDANSPTKRMTVMKRETFLIPPLRLVFSSVLTPRSPPSGRSAWPRRRP